MDIVTSFDPNAKTTDTFATNLSNGIGKIIVWNESNWILDITFADGTTDLAPAWTATIFELEGPAGKITWKQDTQLTGSQAPISKCWVVAYRDSETIPGVFPLALVRQVNVGSTVTTVGAQTSVVNDGAALTPSNVFVEATPTGAASSVVSIATDGTVTIKGDVAGVLTTLIQTIIAAAPGASSVKLGDAARQVEVLGSLLVDGNTINTGTFEVTGATDLDSTLDVSGISTLDSGGANTIVTDGAGRLTVNGAGTGLTVTNNALVSGTTHGVNTATFDGVVNVGSTLNVTGVAAINTTALSTVQLIIIPNADNAQALRLTRNSATQSANMLAVNSELGALLFAVNPGGALVLVNGGTLSAITTFSGSGNGTVATGITNPSAIAFDPCTVSGSSQTIGGTNASSSVVTTGAALAWRGTAWHN